MNTEQRNTPAFRSIRHSCGSRLVVTQPSALPLQGSEGDKSDLDLVVDDANDVTGGGVTSPKENGLERLQHPKREPHR